MLPLNITPPEAKLTEGLYQDSTAVRRGHIRKAGLGRKDLEQARRTVRSLIDSLDTVAET